MSEAKTKFKGFHLTEDSIRMLDELTKTIGQGNGSATVRHCIYQEHKRNCKKK